MVPPKLMLSITGLREQAPFPTVIEVFIMEFMFEGLREAGIRLPQQIGPLVSIVGALVIGQAAVQAGIISAPIVIVVSAAGISSFVIPRYRFGYPMRMLRFPLLVLSGIFGLFGTAIGMIAILSHLIHLTPFGSPYLQPVTPTRKSRAKNVFLRSPRKRATSLTGCWNLKEPNQRAFIIGVGMDMTEDKELEISSEIAVPAGLGSSQVTGAGKKNTFTVASAKGKDFMDAGQHLQAELSRSLFYAHRQTILIGHRMAEEGLGKYLDMIFRNPKSELRSVILVVKDGTAKEVIKAEPTFDPFISTTLGSQQYALGMKPYYYRMLLCDAFSEGTQPIVPAITADPSRGYIYAGSAILDKDHGIKLVGYLDPEESMYNNWMMVKHQPQINISLHGTGSIVENNSSLDPSKDDDLKTIQTKLSQEAEEKVRKLVEKAQHQYKIDIFGIGEQVHRQHPEIWKTLKPHWHETFPELPITVSVHLRYRDPGQTNSSM
ncbi:hypothetical protein BGX30_004885 [Mortierella sp. GBA39]|nr:hypothetical protein BGX30_004885 [Mortierella sp. GBA39]